MLVGREMTEGALAKAIKRHIRLKKKDPALYALAIEFETARFAKKPVAEIVDRIVKHKNRERK